MAGYRLVMDAAAMDKMLRAPDGPVAGLVLDLAQKTQMVGRAKAYSPRVQDHPVASTIVKRFYTTELGVGCLVGSPSPIALYLHEGTEPHDIYPRRAKMLRFVKDGRVVFALHVRHPGTKPNRFLTDALAEVMAAEGIGYGR